MHLLVTLKILFMNNNQFELLKNLGYFSAQHLYLNLTSITLLSSTFGFIENPTEEDKNILYTSIAELVDISNRTFNQISDLLNSVQDLHTDDVQFFRSLQNGYADLTKLGELLQIFCDDFFGERDFEDSLQDFNEYSAIAKYTVLKIVNPQMVE